MIGGARSGSPREPCCEDGDRTGRVVAAHGRRVVVADGGTVRHDALIKGRRLRPVCGDRGCWRRQPDDTVVVTRIQPRSTELVRPDSRGRPEVLAANVSQLAVVLAPRPAPDVFLVDRYLVAARLMGAAALLVANKADLDGARAMDLAEFGAAGYRVQHVSAARRTGLAPLAAALAGHTSILVGQSGVGKSSLLNALVPGLDARTRALSGDGREGRHTTTSSALHPLPGGGELIDSPGVRDYAPPPVPPRELAHGFPEFDEPGRRCRFADCRHLAEPGCAVKDALASGTISTRRYESYQRLLERHEELSRR